MKGSRLLDRAATTEPSTRIPAEVPSTFFLPPMSASRPVPASSRPRRGGFGRIGRRGEKERVGFLTPFEAFADADESFLAVE